MFSNSSSSSNVVWITNCSNVSDFAIYTTSANSTHSNNVEFNWVIPRCRVCKHSHFETGCFDTVGPSVAFVLCSCKEHVPEDNLEYLEYLIKKKETL
jgi:hypothetical protein